MSRFRGVKTDGLLDQEVRLLTPAPLEPQVAFWSLKPQKDRSTPVRRVHADTKTFHVHIRRPRIGRALLCSLLMFGHEQV